MTVHSPKPTALVVDDEYLIAVAIEACLTDVGFAVIIATSSDQALSILAESSIEVAVIDMHLGDSSSTAGVVASLDQRGIPFAICTGSMLAEARERFPGRPIVAKPFLDREIKDAVRSLAAASAVG
jgi:CheY-like chemotaxis protein